MAIKYEDYLILLAQKAAAEAALALSAPPPPPPPQTQQPNVTVDPEQNAAPIQPEEEEEEHEGEEEPADGAAALMSQLESALMVQPAEDEEEDIIPSMVMQAAEVELIPADPAQPNLVIEVPKYGPIPTTTATPAAEADASAGPQGSNGNEQMSLGEIREQLQRYESELNDLCNDRKYLETNLTQVNCQIKEVKKRIYKLEKQFFEQTLQ